MSTPCSPHSGRLSAPCACNGGSWYEVTWSDGEREPSTEDYPPFLAVNEMKRAYLEVISRDVQRSGRYDFAWLPSYEHRATLARLGPEPISVETLRKITADPTALESFIEAAAWWKVGLSDGRANVARAATEALLAGLEGNALAELAGIPNDINPFELDALIERVADDLDLGETLTNDLELLAVRRLCRAVLVGELSERELTRWVYEQFLYKSPRGLIERLAVMDADFDLAEAGIRGSVSKVAAQVRKTAAQIITGAQ